MRVFRSGDRAVLKRVQREASGCVAITTGENWSTNWRTTTPGTNPSRGKGEKHLRVMKNNQSSTCFSNRSFLAPSDFIMRTPQNTNNELSIIITVNTEPYPLTPYVPLTFFIDTSVFYFMYLSILFYFIIS